MLKNTYMYLPLIYSRIQMMIISTKYFFRGVSLSRTLVHRQTWIVTQ